MANPIVLKSTHLTSSPISPSASTPSHPDLCNSCLSILRLYLSHPNVSPSPLKPTCCFWTVNLKYLQVFPLCVNYTYKSSHSPILPLQPRLALRSRWLPLLATLPHLMPSPISGLLTAHCCAEWTSSSSLCRKLMPQILLPLTPVRHPLCHLFLLAEMITGAAIFVFIYATPNWPSAPRAGDEACFHSLLRLSLALSRGTGPALADTQYTFTDEVK